MKENEPLLGNGRNLYMTLLFNCLLAVYIFNSAHLWFCLRKNAFNSSAHAFK